MNTPKLITLFLIVILFSCSFKNVLSHHQKKYYKEVSEFYLEYHKPQPDSLFTLSQYVQSNWMDEEYVEQLTLKIIDTIAVKKKLTLDLVADTTIIKPFYNFNNFMSDLNAKDYRVSGQITILSWTPTLLQLKEYVVVTTSRSEKPIRFKGKRTFIRNVEMENP